MKGKIVACSYEMFNLTLVNQRETETGKNPIKAIKQKLGKGGAV